MIPTIWKDVGYEVPGPESIDKLGVLRMRNFAGHNKEQMLSDAFLTLCPGGSLFLVADLEWSTAGTISEVEAYGFDYVSTFDHKVEFGYDADYQVQTLLFTKVRPRSPREYAMEHYRNVPDGAKVLDVGPGNFPLPLATHYLETPNRKNHPEYVDQWLPDPAKIIWDRIDSLGCGVRLGYKAYDFVWASHVFEHLDDPAEGARNLSYIGKRGVLICPGHLKEALFLWEEADHKWDVFAPSAPGGPVRFVRRDTNLRSKLQDSGAAGALCRMFRTGPPRTHDHRALAAWYRRVEPMLDVIVPWTDALKVQVID